MTTSNKTKLSLVSLVLAAIAFAGMALVAPSSFGEGPKSLRGETKIDEDNKADEILTVEEGQRFTKNYRQQPPVIPHRIDKYEIDLKVNQCMRCHDWPNNVDEGAPKISETHYVDRDGNALDYVSRSRWFCTQCHVPQADAEPIIKNTFKPSVGN